MSQSLLSTRSSYKEPSSTQTTALLSFLVKIRKNNKTYKWLVGFYIFMVLYSILFNQLITPNENPGNPHPFPLSSFESNLSDFEANFGFNNAFYTPENNISDIVMNTSDCPSYVKSEKELIDKVESTNNSYGLIFDSDNLSQISIRAISSTDNEMNFTLFFYQFYVDIRYIFMHLSDFAMRAFPSIPTKDYFTSGIPLIGILGLAFGFFTSYSQTLEIERHQSRVFFGMFINGLSRTRFYLATGLFYFIECLILSIPDIIMLEFALPTKGMNLLILLTLFLFTILVNIACNFICFNCARGKVSLGIVILIRMIAIMTGYMLIMFFQNIPAWIYDLLMVIFPCNGLFYGLAVGLFYTPLEMKDFYIGSPISMADVFLFSTIQLVLYAFITLFFILCVDLPHGKAPLGIKKLFKLGAWKALLAKHEVISEGEATLRFNHLNKVYSDRKKTVGLKDVSLSINAGEVITIIGPNGSGKSTLINSLTGEFDIDSGRIEAFGEDVTYSLTMFYDHLGVAFQEDILDADLTAGELLIYYSRIARLPESEYMETINKYSSMLGITDRLDTKNTELSGGEKRKVSLLLALLRNPSYLILDEPTTGVDATSRQLIWKTLGSLRDCTIIITTHALEEAESVTSRLVVMKQAEIIFCGTPEDLRHQYECGYLLNDVEKRCNMQELLGIIQKFNSKAKIDENNERTIIFPADGQISEIIDAIDENKENIGLGTYTLHLENLEDVLIKFIMTQESLLLE